MSSQDHPVADGLDRWTIGAIAVVAYCLANVIHEGGGHGGACLLVGGRPVTLNAIFFECDTDGLPRFAARVVSAGGSILNVIVAAGLLAITRFWQRPPSSIRFFLWLLTALNLLTAFGYLMFSGLAGFGDWAAVIDGLPGVPILRVAEVVVGCVLYFYVTAELLWRGLVPFLGADPAQRVQRAKMLTVFPYFVGGLTYVAAGVLNPYGMKLVLLSAAAASFGGTSLLVWFFRKRAAKATSGDWGSLGIAKSVGWLLAAAVVLAVFIGVLGKGVSL